MVIIRGLDEVACGLCGRRVEHEDDVAGFPAFLPARHPLASFSDAVFHRVCLERSEDGRAALELYARFRAIWETRPRGPSPAEIERWGREAFAEFP
jgi:hypothetical protein